MGILDNLANFANAVFPDGINWAEQIQAYGSREGSVEFFKQTKDAGPMASGGYYNDLIMARGDTVLLFEQIGVDARMSLPEYQAGKGSTQTVIEQNQSMLQAALDASSNILVAPIILDGPKLRDLLQGHVALLNAAIEMHKTKLIFRMGWTNTQVADHAQMIARCWKQLRYLLASGTLTSLQKSTSGLGVVQIPASVVILTLGIIAIIAAAIVYSIYLVTSLAAAERACQVLTAAKDPAAGMMCTNLIPKPPAGPADIVNNVIFYGAIGLGIYALITYMPYLTSQVVESRRRLA